MLGFRQDYGWVCCLDSELLSNSPFAPLFPAGSQEIVVLLTSSCTDASFLPQNAIMQSKLPDTSAARRATICYTGEVASYDIGDAAEMFSQPLDPFCDTPYRNTSRPNNSSQSAGKTIRIVPPPESPTSIRRQLTNDIAALYSSNRTQENRTMRNLNNSHKKRHGILTNRKEKRNSAPPILTSINDGDQTPTRKNTIEGPRNELVSPATTIYPLLHSQSVSPKRLFPALIHKNQRTRPQSHTSSSLSHSRVFGLDLSPIIEDTNAFGEYFELNEDSVIPSIVDSSGSSYGQLLEDMNIDYFSASQYSAFAGLEWGYDQRRQTDYSSQLSAQGFGDVQDPDWGDDHLEALEDSVLIPGLTLTVPTPDLGNAARFPAERYPDLPVIDEVLDWSIEGPTSTQTILKNSVPSDLGRICLDTYPKDSDSLPGPLGNSLNNPLDGANLTGRQKSEAGFVTCAGVGSDSGNTSRRFSGFRWPTLRRENRTEISSKIERGAGRVWSRLSRVLATFRTPFGHQQSGDRTYLDAPCTTVTPNWASSSHEPRYFSARHSDLSNQLSCSDPRSSSWAFEKHSSGSPLRNASACILEDGEHAASRLFGLPNIGKKQDASTFWRAETSEIAIDGGQPRRSDERNTGSFGFSMKGIGSSRHRRYVEDDTGCLDCAREIHTNPYNGLDVEE
ncbi:hypothetical protein GALMADRAFT_132522 [Galerina marginata CBS 339.88]|uniref:Uncharacterized protein n=1 Tax=Galerina marginata (strain CBS 339.88) TaxID=685588 RepID=A0A067U3A5_GALM3|nr:hypothetical protein GALMADRAFT_132522 [Galerina marginata CBS 339.88]